VAAAFDTLDAAVTAIGELNFENFDPAVRLRALKRLETARRRQAVLSHDLVAGLAKGTGRRRRPCPQGCPDWLRIGCAEALRRMPDSEQLASRITLTGKSLPPELRRPREQRYAFWRASNAGGEFCTSEYTALQHLSHHQQACTGRHFAARPTPPLTRPGPRATGHRQAHQQPPDRRGLNYGPVRPTIARKLSYDFTASHNPPRPRPEADAHAPRRQRLHGDSRTDKTKDSKVPGEVQKAKKIFEKYLAGEL
jgi:hypothetical protein